MVSKLRVANHCFEETCAPTQAQYRRLPAPSASTNVSSASAFARSGLARFSHAIARAAPACAVAHQHAAREEVGDVP